jgi:hypothetical protein
MFDGAISAGCPLLADPSGIDVAAAKAAAIQLMALRLTLLGEMAQIGMKMMRPLAPTDAAPAETSRIPQTAKSARQPDPAADYDRLARSVRLTLRFEAETAQALCDVVAGEAKANEAREAERERREARAAEERHEAVKREASRRIMIIAETEAPDPDEMDDVYEALEERLKHDEAYEDLSDRPLREVIEALCHDLDLAPDFSDWTEDDFAMPEDRLAPRRRGSPFERPSRRPILVTGPIPEVPFLAGAPPAPWPRAGGP